MVGRLLLLGRHMAWIPVISSILGAFVLAVAGAVEGARATWTWAAVERVGAGSAKALALQFVIVADLFLIATALLLIGLGLYSLLLDPTLELPASLRVGSLYDLKDKLVTVVVVVLAIFFLGEAVQEGGCADVAMLGGAIAAVIAALTWFVSRRRDHG